MVVVGSSTSEPRTDPNARSRSSSHRCGITLVMLLGRDVGATAAARCPGVNGAAAPAAAPASTAQGSASHAICNVSAGTVHGLGAINDIGTPHSVGGEHG